MSQTAKAQEPSMEEILASIRRIIADDDAGKSGKPAEPPPAAAAPEPKPVIQPVVRATPPPPPPPPPAASRQDEIDAMLAAPESEAEPPKDEPDVLDLTEAMAAPATPPKPAGSFRTIDAASDVVFTDRPPEPPRAEEPRQPPAPAFDSNLLSASTAAAVDQAFNSLAHTVLGNNARTLEDLVKEMLRPMLKSWLDDNLPGLVERIVRAEIERVSRGRG